MAVPGKRAAADDVMPVPFQSPPARPESNCERTVAAGESVE
jgi:hypothetical protein